MLIPKKNRRAILAKLFEDSVLCAKKDFFLPSHYELVDIPNLQVIKLMLSLESLDYVKENFNWNWYFWTITDKGIAYIREYLHLPEEIVPRLLHPEPIPDRGRLDDNRGRGRGRGFRDQPYR